MLNFSAQSESSSNRGLGLNANHWHVHGLTVERTATAYNRDTGLRLGRLERQDRR
ncbi:hypothetical protein ACWDBW_18880 [Streptomyces sp. NPDC001107]